MVVLSTNPFNNSNAMPIVNTIFNLYLSLFFPISRILNYKTIFFTFTRVLQNEVMPTMPCYFYMYYKLILIPCTENHFLPSN